MTPKTSSIFEFHDYKQYLQAALPTQGGQRGLRSRLADALRVQTSFISRVLSGPADFSAEHAMVISDFLQHSELERDYLVLLIHHARAGSQPLQKHYLKQIRAIQERRQQVRERIQVRTELSREGQMTYYSAWYYAAIHVLVMVPRFQSAPALSHALNLPLARVTECLEFLAANGLVAQDGASYRAGAARIHLGPDSPMISKHHANWRTRALHALDIGSEESLFFSGPLAISEADARRIKSMLLKTLEEIEPVVRVSEEEAVFCLNFDFFRC